MKKDSRRLFLKKIAVSGSALALAANPLEVFSKQEGKKRIVTTPVVNDDIVKPIDFRYSPSNWQSTFCFPDDPYKSLIGKSGQLLYGHPGLNADLDAFAQTVWFGIKDASEGEYVEQKIESAGVPIFVTTQKFPGLTITTTCFATNYKKEGRVDNVWVEIKPLDQESAQCSPVITIKSKLSFSVGENDEDMSTIFMDGEKKALFMAVTSEVTLTAGVNETYCVLTSGTATSSKPIRFFVRFPQAGQDADTIEDEMDEMEDLIASARTFWQGWKPYDGNVTWQVQGKEQDFFISASRNIQQSRIIKDGKKAFQVGPTVYRGLWMIDGTFLLESALYAGYDKEALEGIDSIWNLQNAEGAIFGGAGETHWKDTPAAIYMIIRNAELTGNWEYFNELWPDMHKAAMYIKSLREKTLNDGTPNGKYGLLPEGFGDSGIGGAKRPEFTNTLWALIALKAMTEVGDRFMLGKRTDIREFYRDIRVSSLQAFREEMAEHKNGFKYLPMLMKADEGWNNPDEKKRPKPQAAQIYLSHAIYPGLVFTNDDPIVTGHVELMKSIIQEDIPAETGWLSNDAVWPYNAPIFAQTLLWLGDPILARKIFVGFLNHASPMMAWREEQSLRMFSPERVIGDMPHNWASAEYIRFVRHCFILEDNENLRLLDGIVGSDFEKEKPMTLTSSPTRWGRITLSLEPIEKMVWKLKFKRDAYTGPRLPKLTYIEFPRKFQNALQLDKVVGKDVKYYKNGDRVLVEPACMEWEATFRLFGRR